MSFRKPPCQSFFSSRVSPFSPVRIFTKRQRGNRENFSSSFSQNQRWTKSAILWEVYRDWLAISQNSAQTCRNVRNDKCIANLRISEILVHLRVFFFNFQWYHWIPDENRSSIAKKIKKSKYDLILLILLTIEIILRISTILYNIMQHLYKFCKQFSKNFLTIFASFP